MKQKNWQPYIVLIVLAIIAGAVWVYKLHWHKAQNPSMSQESPAATTQKSPEAAASSAVSTWAGVLKNSDNPAKGNLMLLMGNRVIYLQTNHDYGNLIDQKVTVSYKGDFNNFSLKDIQPAQ